MDLICLMTDYLRRITSATEARKKIAIKREYRMMKTRLAWLHLLESKGETAPM